MTPLKLETGPLAPHSPGPVFELLFLSSKDMLVSTLLPNDVVFFSWFSHCFPHVGP